MTLTLHYHPLSSFCQKVLIALYETGTPFTPKIVNLMDETERNALRAVWPMGKFPVLQDATRDATIPESSIIIEFLDLHYPGSVRLFPQDSARLLQMRLRDRFFDLHVNVPMQKIVTDRLRPAGKGDAHGVAEARTALQTAFALTEKYIGDKTWIMGDDFTMADCAAAPALFYADMLIPLGKDFPRAAAYLDRLKQRPSFARVLKEAAPYLTMIPKEAAA
jgi:glutathione S-transferase